MYRELVNNATKTYPFLIEHTDVRYIPHFHMETELVYVLEGELEFTLGTQSYIIKKGDICVITPGLIHNLYTHTHSSTFVMKLYPIVDLGRIRLKDSIISRGAKSYDIICSCIKEIIKENREKFPAHELAVNICAEKLYLIILRELEHYVVDSKIQVKSNNENDFLSSVNEFLEEKYAEDFSLGDISEYFNYTRSYFCRIFKKITGNSFWEYYTMFRLEKAGEMIKGSPKENFTVIANKTGFKNVRSFNQAFKEYYRCTPSEYKKMM